MLKPHHGRRLMATDMQEMHAPECEWSGPMKDSEMHVLIYHRRNPTIQHAVAAIVPQKSKNPQVLLLERRVNQAGCLLALFRQKSE